MKKYLFILLAIFMALTSCAKDETYTMEEKSGVKYFSNKGIPSVKEFDPSIKLSMKISGTESDDDTKERVFSRVSDIVVDSKGSINIFDYR